MGPMGNRVICRDLQGNTKKELLWGLWVIGSYAETYKVIPKRNYYGAYG